MLIRVYAWEEYLGKKVEKNKAKQILKRCGRCVPKKWLVFNNSEIVHCGNERSI
jgi:hypothetical protein